jgi:hypothetical protein
VAKQVKQERDDGDGIVSGGRMGNQTVNRVDTFILVLGKYFKLAKQN